MIQLIVSAELLYFVDTIKNILAKIKLRTNKIIVIDSKIIFNSIVR